MNAGKIVYLVGKYPHIKYTVTTSLLLFTFSINQLAKMLCLFSLNIFFIHVSLFWSALKVWVLFCFVNENSSGTSPVVSLLRLLSSQCRGPKIDPWSGKWNSTWCTVWPKGKKSNFTLCLGPLDVINIFLPFQRPTGEFLCVLEKQTCLLTLLKEKWWPKGGVFFFLFNKVVLSS